MKFRDYWYALPKAERAAFAERCETTVGYLNLVASNNAKAGEGLAMRIERESGGQVPVEEIRPDAPWEVVRGKVAA